MTIYGRFSRNQGLIVTPSDCFIFCFVFSCSCSLLIMCPVWLTRSSPIVISFTTQTHTIRTKKWK